MTHTISQGHNEARLGGSRGWLDSGSGNAKIQVYSSPRPAAGAAVGSAVKLVEFVLAKPCGTVADNALPLEPLSPGEMVLNSGEAWWARIVTGDNEWSDDLSVSAVGGDGEVQLSDITLYAGGLAVLVSAVLT